MKNILEPSFAHRDSKWNRSKSTLAFFLRGFLSGSHLSNNKNSATAVWERKADLNQPTFQALGWLCYLRRNKPSCKLGYSTRRDPSGHQQAPSYKQWSCIILFLYVSSFIRKLIAWRFCTWFLCWKVILELAARSHYKQLLSYFLHIHLGILITASCKCSLFLM